MGHESYMPSESESNKAWDQMNPQEKNVSQQREIDLQHLSQEARELLESSSVTMLEPTTELIEGKGVVTTRVISGTNEKGEEIKISLKTPPLPETGYRVAGRGHLNDVPEAKGYTYWSGDNFSGEVGGVEIGPEEAKALWAKYARIAAVNLSSDKRDAYLKGSDEI